ncbi:MAG: OmpH family outer membrane protein [Salibacteraceae bacterium]
MNKALLGWNAILTVAILFLLFGNNTPSTTEVEEIEIDTIVEADTNIEEQARIMAKVVFINNDTLFEYLDMYDDLEDELLAEKIKLEGRYKRELEKLEKDYLDLRERAPFMTQSQGEAAQAKLVQKQQELGQMEQDLSIKFSRKEADMVMKIKSTIEEYCERNKEEFGYDFVLGKSQVGGIHYANPGRDITEEVIEGLNAEYRASKEVKNANKK